MDTILIIEDDRSLNQGLCRALREEGREILSCENLAGARELLFQADLVLLDVNLPDGNGLDFLGKIKRDFPDKPVILLTANDTDIDIVDGLEQGADDYITKPFSLSVLRATLVDRIWTDGADFVEENALSVTVKRLRDKLGAQGYIKTVYGIGYMWVKTDE